MMRFLRSQSQTVLVAILGVLGLAFLFYGNVGNILTSTTNHGQNDYGSIGGDNLTASELFDAIRYTRYTLILQGQDVNQEGIAPKIAEDAWRRLLLEHEADKLHINVTDDELLNYIHQDRLFQDPKTGVFSPDVYQDRLALLQGLFRIPSDSGSDPLATTKNVLVNVLRQEVRIAAVETALFSTIRTPEGNVSSAYEKKYGPVTVSLVTFDPKDFLAGIQVTPDEVAAEYKNHPENPAYRTKEKRKVDYVLFPLTPEEAKLPDQAKSAALEALGQKALDFALVFQPDPSVNPASVTPPDFATEAKKRGLTPVTTDSFAVDAPPAGLPPSPAFNNAAFELTKDEPVSKVIELSDGVAVLHLAEIEAGALRPFDEVKADIQEQLRQAKAVDAANTASKNAALEFQAAQVNGQDFNKAAAALKLKVETLPPLIPAKVGDKDPRLETIAYVAGNLETGQVSPTIPLENNTTIILHVDSRSKADPAGLAGFETSFHDTSDGELRLQVYLDVTDWMDKNPGTHKPPDLDQYGEP